MAPIKRTIGLVRWFETALQGTGWFVLLHDGQQGTDLGKLGNPSFYTRMYRMKLDGLWASTWVKFVYNERDNWADFHISYNDRSDTATNALEKISRKIIRNMETAAASPTEATILVDYRKKGS